jgi:adenylate cyclase
MDGLIEWISRQGMNARSIPELINEFTRELNREGFQLVRSVVLVRTLHPQIESIRFAWEPTEVLAPFAAGEFNLETRSVAFDGSTIAVNSFTHGASIRSAAYLSSPYKKLDDGAPVVRHRLAGLTDFESPVFETLASIGATDYVLLPLATLNAYEGLRNAISFATVRPDGFSDEQAERLAAVAPLFALCLEVQVQRFVTETLLGVYIGRTPGQRVLNGQIRKGDIETMSAAIWYSDLRGYSALAESASPTQLIAWINDYFEAVSQEILDQDGEILKFIGDAILAIFPWGSAPGGVTGACRRALEAAQRANVKLDALNRSRDAAGLPLLAHGIALHLGEVQYGNVGSHRRLDFTAMGSSVNKVARIESLCRSTGRRLLVSEEFAAKTADVTFARVGEFAIKGFAGEIAVHEPAEGPRGDAS